MELTKRQIDALKVVVKHIVKNGKVPTIYEIGKKMKIGPISAKNHLMELHRKGYIKRDNNKHRSVKVIGLQVICTTSQDESGRKLAEILGNNWN